MNQHRPTSSALPSARPSRRAQGFTLIELLVVIAIIAILAVTVFVALNPVQRFRDARNSRRVVDANNYLTAVHACIVDNRGADTVCIGSPTVATAYEIASACPATGFTSSCGSGSSVTNCLDLDTNLANYLATLPVDPQVAVPLTGYTLTKAANGIITINACRAEGTFISAAR